MANADGPLAPKDQVVPRRVGHLDDVPVGYADLLADIKQKIRTAQVRAARAANTELLQLYWSVGHDILVRQEEEGWGAKVIARLSEDLRHEFPNQSGWSVTNLKYMRMMAQAWLSLDSIGQHCADQLPWGHVMVVLARLKTQEDRDWYAERAVAEGWKRNVLEHFIKVRLKDQLGAAPTNFATALDSPDSELAQQLVKDPYVFEHLAYVERVDERSVEQALMDRLQDTLTEFGRGMAFVGRQVRFAVTDRKGRTDELVPDLLLYHIPQSRYVVVELKVDDFTPGYLGQLAAYVGVVDAELRDPNRQAPTIGVLLCTGKNEAIVRYTLANMSAALGVADYEGLPADARAVLPSTQELEAVVADELARHRELLDSDGDASCCD